MSPRVHMFLSRHIPFRESKLTRLLESSIGGNAKTTVVCTVSPFMTEETISTLKVTIVQALHSLNACMKVPFLPLVCHKRSLPAERCRSKMKFKLTNIVYRCV